MMYVTWLMLVQLRFQTPKVLKIIKRAEVMLYWMILLKVYKGFWTYSNLVLKPWLDYEFNYPMNWRDFSEKCQ